MKRFIFIIFLLFIVISGYLLFNSNYFSKSPKSLKKVSKYNEKYYQIQLCQSLEGQIEYVLTDKTRVDCLTKNYAIEVDFAKKWAESIGQSLFYADMTDKKPAVALIVGKNDERYKIRLKRVADKHSIKIFWLTKK